MFVFLCFLLAACSNSDSDYVESNIPEPSPEEKKLEIKKFDAVKLPIDIYIDSEYEGVKGVTFIRSIDAITIEDFNDESIIDLHDRYSQLKNLHLDYNDYKRVILHMSHRIKGDETEKPYEAFILDKQSEFYYNGKPVINEIFEYQLSLASKDFSMGHTFDKKGKVVLAIPKDYLEQGYLQLKTVIRDNDSAKNIYIDLKESR